MATTTQLVSQPPTPKQDTDSYHVKAPDHFPLRNKDPLLVLSLTTKMKQLMDANYSDLTLDEFHEIVSTLAEELACFALITPEHDAVCLHTFKVITICAKSWTTSPVLFSAKEEWPKAKKLLKTMLDEHFPAPSIREQIVCLLKSKHEILHEHAREISKRRRAACVLLRQNATRALLELQKLEHVSLNLNRAFQQSQIDQSYMDHTTRAAVSPSPKRKSVVFAPDLVEIIGEAEENVDRTPIQSSFPSTKELLLIRATRSYPKF